MQRGAGKLWPFNERLERRPHRWGTSTTTTATTIGDWRLETRDWRLE